MRQQSFPPFVSGFVCATCAAVIICSHVPKQTVFNASEGGSVCTADIFPAGGDDMVNVSDLLEVINQWGSCIDCAPPDTFEPNNDCNSVKTLATVGSDGMQMYTTLNLDSDSDVDLFRINALETDNTCFDDCLDLFEEDYELTITVTLPPDAPWPVTFCSGIGSCAASNNNCQTVNPGQSVPVLYYLNGSCSGQPDAYSAFIRIEPSGSGRGCPSYSLSYHFNANVCRP